MSFGDIRVAHRAEWLIERIAVTGSVVLRRLGETRAGEMAIHRFLSSPYVAVEQIVESLAARTAQQCAGRHVLVVQDTTEITFAGRDKKRRGFGPTSNGKVIGFFIHPVIAVDVETEAMIGLVDATIWTRPESQPSRRRSRAASDKESARWLGGCQHAASLLQRAASLTMVSDRESDIYSLFARRPAKLHLIVRAAQDRNLAEGGKLFARLSGAPCLMTTKVKVAPRGPGDRGRVASVELRAGKVRIARPENGLVEDLPKSVEMTLVEAHEVGCPPDVKEPLHWRLLTSHDVGDAAQAVAVVQLYRLRWRIEETFRALKSDGLALEDSQVITPERLFNLAAMALGAAIRTIQLVDARHGSSRPLSDIVDACFTPALLRLSRNLEGSTERQKNPYPPHSLAFLAWIVARLGGWNCYYKPPGPKTMRSGWNQLTATLAGYTLATQGQDP
ncbi:MAG: IS4 family transposase [Methylobacteriaceae bacterium]|nr:IS4 family transposase [Methylobacteriaceae bacterium]MBV9635557.1 IS4 family transposase [Methylobacteriaceae bacterium]